MPSRIGGYPYTCQLMALDQCRESSGYLSLPNQLASVTSPVNLDFWKEHLRDHEDQIFSQLVLQGLIAGFRIGFQREAVLLRSARSNMISASTHQEVASIRISGARAEGGSHSTGRHRGHSSSLWNSY